MSTKRRPELQINACLLLLAVLCMLLFPQNLLLGRFTDFLCPVARSSVVERVGTRRNAPLVVVVVLGARSSSSSSGRSQSSGCFPAAALAPGARGIEADERAGGGLIMAHGQRRRTARRRRQPPPPVTVSVGARALRRQRRRPPPLARGDELQHDHDGQAHRGGGARPPPPPHGARGTRLEEAAGLLAAHGRAEFGVRGDRTGDTGRHGRVLR